ncbi:hypothetical protein [Pseudomonas fluorescens]|uniref:hypothetical protein n=1 Tax=Pseudomonas fluorescens TaxID=294 RepID=UPI00073234A1|nr:hypothetical protein [Pseudomonas fluorescens]
MTVPTLNSVAEFATNGVTTNFPFFFKFLANEDLVVTYVNPAGVSSVLAFGTQYTANGAGDEDGGSVVTTTALAGPGQLIVSREMDAYQQTSLRNQGKFLAETHEDVFDRLTMLIQQGFSIFKRALVRPFGRDYYDAENRRIANVADPVEPQDAATAQWTGEYVADLIEQISGPINNAANIYITGADGLPHVVQDIGNANGSQVVGHHGGTLEAALDGLDKRVGLELVLDAKTDGTDQTAVVVAFFSKVLTENRPWMVPSGDYVINPTSPITIKTSGVCNGRFLVPKANQTFRFDILRDVAGTVIPTGSWTALQRGTTNASALNAVGKNLFISSTEVLIERIGSGGAPYLKQEFIRCPLPGGIFSTAITRNYNFNTNLTVTAHTPSVPISIEGLSILLTGQSGGVESNRGTIVVTRDNVVMDQPSVINADPAQPRPVAIEVSYCADVTLNQPHVRGFNYGGLGYGILNGTTIGLTVNQPVLEDCRHAYTGAYTVDVVLNGGSYSRVIDDHWTDRFTANDVKVYAQPGASAFEFAGDDITINNPQQFGGRSLLGIRVDTPSLGGKVVVKNPRIQTRGESGAFHLFGFSSPGGPGAIGFTYTNKPRLPDTVVIEDARIDSDTAVVYGAYLGSLLAPHTTWGTICLRGQWTFTGSTVIGIFAEKNATYQQDRRPLLACEATMDCGANGTAVYVIATDAVTTNAMDVKLTNTVRGALRYSGYSVNNLRANNATITNMVDDNAAATPLGASIFSGCWFTGGAVSATLKNMAFQACQFTGNYTAFPIAANVTMVGNIKGTTVTGLPADIRANVVAPFS